MYRNTDIKETAMSNIPIKEELKELEDKLEEEIEWDDSEEIDESEWLKAVARNPAFDFLKDPEEDIYTLADGKPFYDPQWSNAACSDANFVSIFDQEEDIYTLADGKPFND
jgi:hypothetical protein